MPKQLYEIKDFSGGLNAYADPRDIEDVQFSQNWNVIVDKNGILRIVGSAVESIDSTQLPNENFMKGYGLFQFNTDYSIAVSGIDGEFQYGYKEGIIVARTDAKNFRIASTSSSTDDYYNGMTIFIYEGPGIGESRKITDYDASGHANGANYITVGEDFVATLTTSSKYKIFRWQTDNWELTHHEKDFIVNSSSDNAIASNGDYFIGTKNITAITDEQTMDLGNISFISEGTSTSKHLTLSPGVLYNLSLDCVAKDRWYNLVSNGYKTGITDTGINANESESISNSSVTLTVNGTNATAANILNRDVYKSDGTFIGRCTAVNSVTEIVFANGIQTALASTNDLYVAGFGERPPWIELYSETVKDDSGTIAKFTDTDGTSGGTSWQASQSHVDVEQSETSGTGSGVRVSITTNVGQDATLTGITSGGINYSPGDTVTFIDPGSSSNTVVFTIGSSSDSVNTNGLALYDGGKWLSKNSNSSPTGADDIYLKFTGINYVQNGDFTNAGDSSSTNDEGDYLTGWSEAHDASLELTSPTYSDTSAEYSSTTDPKCVYGGHDGSIRIKNYENGLITMNGGNDPQVLVGATLQNAWIYQELRLSSNTEYHLNFYHTFYLNSGTNENYNLKGIQFAIYDKDNEAYLTSWQSSSDEYTLFHNNRNNEYAMQNNLSWENGQIGLLPFSPYIDGASSAYPGYKTYNKIPNGPIHPFKYDKTTLKESYCKFTVPYDKDSTSAKNRNDRKIEIRFTNEVGSRDAHLFNVSVYKSNVDLNCMSKYGGANPYSNNIKTWSTFDYGFRIPENFNEVDDWVLKIHAGSAGYRVSNELGQTNTQEVYIDNIKISSSSSRLNALNESGDISLLTTNSNNKSFINIWDGSTWNKLFNFSQGNAQFTFDYVSGMLKISDGNFNTNIANQLLYLDERNGIKKWKITDNVLPIAPTPLISDIPPLTFDENAFDATILLNLIAQKYPPSFTLPPGDAYHNTFLDFLHKPHDSFQEGASFRWTNWPLDSWGPNSSTGHIIRYTADEFPEGTMTYSPEDVSIATNGGQCIADPEDPSKQMTSSGLYMKKGSTGVTGYSRRLYSLFYNQNQDTDLSNNTFVYSEDDANVDSNSFQNNGFYGSHHVMRGIILARGDQGHTHNANGAGLLSNSMTAGHGMLDFIEGDENETVNVDSVSMIKYKIRWEASLASSMSDLETIAAGVDTRWLMEQCKLPVFLVSAGKVNTISNLGEAKDILQINEAGDSMSVESVRKNIHGVTSYEVQPVWDGFGDTITYGYSHDDSQDGTTQGQYNSAKVTRIELTNELQHEYKQQYIVEVTIEGILSWAKGVIPLDEDNISDLFFEVEEEPIHDETQPSHHEPLKRFIDPTSIYQSEGSEIASNSFIKDWGFYYNTGTRRADNDNLADTSYNPGDSSVTPINTRTQGLERHTMDTGYEFPRWTRFFVDELDVSFYSEGSEGSITDLSGTTLGVTSVNMIFKTGGNPSGWGGRDFLVATSTVNIFDEESSLTVSELDSDGFAEADESQAPTIEVLLDKTHYYNNFIKKTKYYYQDEVSDTWYLQFWIDHKTGKMHSSTSSKTSSFIQQGNNRLYWILNAKYFQNFNEVSSYESETLVSQKDALDKQNMSCRYASSVVCNNRLYVGNIYQNGRKYGDRMLKSPINKYNILPSSNFIDVAINDGDEITALSYYKDKLLQFKKKKVFVINVSGDFEFLEDTFHDVGVDGQYSVVTTAFGITWANETGCYLYDGKELTNLIENKLPTSEAYANPASEISKVNRWCANADTGDCIVGYIRHKQTLLVSFTRSSTTSGAVPTGATYHFPTKSWALIYGIWNSLAASNKTGNMSNMITNSDGDVLFYHIDSSGSVAEKVNTIRKWSHESNNTLGTKASYFVTKDITFGNINVKKKLYKVYITYRVNGDSAVNVHGSINGTGDFSAIGFSQTSKFINTSSNCYAGGTLDTTGGDWKTAELKFDTPSEVNNITSFQLQLSGGSVLYDFEVNDISISYKVKNVK